MCVCVCRKVGVDLNRLQTGKQRTPARGQVEREDGGQGEQGACSAVLPSDEECHLVLFFSSDSSSFSSFSLSISLSVSSCCSVLM